MKIILMNMVKISDKETDKVVVLDKVKKEGWEGLTFPGGKVEIGEFFAESVIREAKEETNLDIKNPKFVGIITWLTDDRKDVGLLYETNDFEGNLVKDNREGKLSWINYEEFKIIAGKSMSMDKILDIYDGKYSEVLWDLRDDQEKIYYF